MENPEEVLQMLERFTKLKQKEIPRELDDYLGFVARTGDTVYRWAIVKHLFREKLVHVITDFHDNTPSIADLPQCPNVDPFNYERMKRVLLERLDAFNSAPFTVQRICELLCEPRKQYTRIDKYMRAVEKNILVVSTQEPGRRRSDSENGDSLDSIVNGDLEVNVDIEMDNEAFGIDGGEIAPTAAAATAAAATDAVTSAIQQEEESVPPAVAAKPVEAVPKEAEESGDSATEPTVEKTDEAKEEKISEEPAAETSVAEEGPVEGDIPKDDDSKPLEQSDAKQEPNPAEEASPAEDLPVPDVQHSAEEPAKESHEIVKDLPDGASTVEPTSDPNDDGQPQPKQAKLSDEPVEPVEQTTTTSVETDSLEPEKDEVSSASTTDSGESSTSVESEPSASTNSTESAIPVESTESTEPAAESAPEITPEPENPEPQIPSEPTVSEVQTPEVAPIVPEPIPTIEEPVVGVEMETAAAAPSAPAVLVPESVMATDEEETIQSPTDVAVPMAADVVPEAAKPDDNAMDVDESSVEPMDQ